MIIEPKIINTTLYYHITSANRTIVGNQLMEFVQQKVVSIEVVEKSNRHKKFELKLVTQKMEGTALLHQWAADMDELQSRLIIITDEQGNITDVENFMFLQYRWNHGFKQKLGAKYSHHKAGAELLINETDKLLKNKEQYLKTFMGYSSNRFFFPGYFGDHESSKKSELELKNYFGTIDLPLIITTNTLLHQDLDNTLVLENTAVLDEDRFERKSFAQMLKELTGVYDVKARLEVDMEEKLFFDKRRNLLNGDLYLETAANNFYSVTSAHKILKISDEEKSGLVNYLTDKETDGIRTGSFHESEK